MTLRWSDKARMFATAVELLRNHLQWDGPVRLNVIGMRTAVGVPVLKKINLNVARDPAIPESEEPTLSAGRMRCQPTATAQHPGSRCSPITAALIEIFRLRLEF